jgi:cysteine-rich repeat protein
MKQILLALFALAWSITANAQSAYSSCGDGIVEQGEFCDDGNNIDGDLCSSNCLFGAPSSGLQTTPTNMPRNEPPPPYRPYPSLMLNPAHAFGLSLASTVLTAGMIPSLGHLYAGEYRRAFASWGLRLGASFVTVVGFAVLIATAFDGSVDCPDNGLGCGGGAFLLGGGTMLGTMIFDVADAPNAARRSNQRGKRPWQLGLAPSSMPALGGGFSLQLKF